MENTVLYDIANETAGHCCDAMSSTPYQNELDECSTRNYWTNEC